MTLRNRAVSRPGAAKVALAIVAGTLLGAAAIQSAVTENRLAAGDVVAWESTADPRTIMAGAVADLGTARGIASQAAVDAALQASRRAPLHEGPFVLAGAKALRAGEQEQAERLLSEARRRNPRSRPARFLLLEHYVTTGRPRAAATELAVLTRLMPGARPILVAALARLSESALNNPAIVNVLRSDPAVQRDVLEYLAARQTAPGVLLRLSAGRLPQKGARWPRLVLNDLVERGDVSTAYAFWRRLPGVMAEPTPATVYNSGFDDLAAPPPFNWRFTDTPSGVAQPLGAGSLRVEHRGGDRAPLASQLLLLSPGFYVLSFEAKGDAGGPEARFVWTLDCHRSHSRLVSVPVASAALLPVPVDAEFAVPPGCAAQWLRLSGTHRPAAESVSVTISAVTIKKSDGGL